MDELFFVTFHIIYFCKQGEGGLAQQPIRKKGKLKTEDHSEMKTWKHQYVILEKLNCRVCLHISEHLFRKNFLWTNLRMTFIQSSKW